MQVLHYAPESAFAEGLQMLFAADDHFVHRVGTTEDIPSFSSFYELDCVLLDPRHEHGAAIAWLRQQRSLGNMVPALIITAAPIAADEAVAWLDLADDIVRLPIDNREVLARIQAVIRRRLAHASVDLSLENVSLNLRRQTVRVDGRAVHTTRKEFLLLEALFIRPNAVLTKEMLLTQLYGGSDDEPEMKIIDVFICKLRKKLTSAGASPFFIGTVWGRGYSLSHDARRADAARHETFETRVRDYGQRDVA